MNYILISWNKETSTTSQQPNLAINCSLEPQTFLKYNLPLHYIRLIAQLRTSSKHCIKISLYNTSHIIDPQKICQACNHELESLHHILISCPAYVSYRSQLFKNIPNYLNSPSPIVEIFNNLNEQTTIHIYKFFFNVFNKVHR